MMDEALIQQALAGLPVNRVVSLAETGSTNDVAQELLEQGAPGTTLVVAEAQTQGRGRLGRQWVTTPGAALAFSLALHPTAGESERLAFFSPLAGLAVCQALVEEFHLPAQVKWPNDVLLNRRKTCGVLAEAAWTGERLQGVVVGIGVNVAPASVPPDSDVMFPATCVEGALREATGQKSPDQAIDRVELLAQILDQFFSLRPSLGSPEFLRLWQERLAFRGEWVRVDPAAGETLTGRLMGVDAEGNLRLQTQAGEEIHVAVGDVRLRLA